MKDVHLALANTALYWFFFNVFNDSQGTQLAERARRPGRRGTTCEEQAEREHSSQHAQTNHRHTTDYSKWRLPAPKPKSFNKFYRFCFRDRSESLDLASLSVSLSEV